MINKEIELHQLIADIIVEKKLEETPHNAINAIIFNQIMLYCRHEKVYVRNFKNPGGQYRSGLDLEILKTDLRKQGREDIIQAVEGLI